MELISSSMLAIVFPGQGSQSLGMLADIAAQFPEVKQTFDEASQVLGYDLWQLTQQGPASELDKTVHTQPALLAGGVAIWRILQARIPLTPVALAGHSLGEYTALVCAQALAFPQAITLVAARGSYMQEAVAPGIGAMGAIIGLDAEGVRHICKLAAAANEVVSPAGFNSLEQVVVAGHKPAVERALQFAEAQGAKFSMLIPVSVPSHCELMQPAALRLANLLATIDITPPKLSILNNVAALRYDSVHAIRDGLTKQLYLPVRWVDIIQSFLQLGITQIVECGPGKVLTGLIKRIDKQLTLTTTSDLASLDALLRGKRHVL